MNVTNYSLWTAVVTPLTQTSGVDYRSLSSVVRDQEEAGNGLLILGSTAEALNLPLEEKKKIVDHVIAMNPKTPIMVGVGGHQLEETLEWINFLETKNINAYLMVTPIYAKPGPVGQYQWFKTLMDAVTKPVMLYNVPGRSAVAMATEAVEKLSNHKNFWAIKEASGSVEKFKAYLKAANGKPVYCGDDALMPDFALAGAAGLVSVASNAWPKETNLYVKKCLDKTFDDKQLWTDASNSLFVASNPVPVKRLMFENGKIATPFMVSPLTHEDMADATPVLKANEAVKNWFQRNSK
jgi:4-hydroxy-tetrahydrodipicolinate synthase